MKYKMFLNFSGNIEEVIVNEEQKKAIEWLYNHDYFDDDLTIIFGTDSNKPVDLT